MMLDSGPQTLQNERSVPTRGMVDNKVRNQSIRVGVLVLSQGKRVTLRATPVRQALPGRESTEGADSHCILSTFPAHVLEGVRQGAVLVQAEVGHHECEGGRHPKVSNEANQEGSDDPHGDGLLRVLDFFT